MQRSEKRTILVTGATGKQGGAVLRHLTGGDFQLRALTRTPESDSARVLSDAGIDVIRGDFDDIATLEPALDGVWGVFAVQTFEGGVEREQGQRVARIARERGVRHFVYSSVGSAHRNTGVPHFKSKWRIEETVRTLGFPSWTILRPVFFMENLVSPWILQEDRLTLALTSDTTLQMIAVDDIGRFGARAFDHPEEFKSEEIDLAGDALTPPESAVVLREALGRPIEFAQLPIEEVRRFSEDAALMFEWFRRVGFDADIPALPSRYGIRPLTLREWARSLRS